MNRCYYDLMVNYSNFSAVEDLLLQYDILYILSGYASDTFNIYVNEKELSQIETALNRHGFKYALYSAFGLWGKTANIKNF